jgi:xanthine dehydrogenase accessory factor
MVVLGKGQAFSTVGGGLFESACTRAALQAIGARRSDLVRFTFDNKIAADHGMVCGGTAEALVEYLDPSDPRCLDHFRQIVGSLERKCSCTRVLVAREVPGGLEVTASLEDEKDPGLETTRKRRKRSAAPKGVEAVRGFPDSQAADATASFVDLIGPAETLYVFGAGHIARELVPLCARIGFSVVVTDDRVEFASRERFPDADRVVVSERLADILGDLPLDSRSYLVIVTRGHRQDREVLEQALTTPAGYIGMIGSRNKWRAICEALIDQGVSPQQLERIHCPIGLDIGAETPEEIAVSIAAELIAVRAGKGAPGKGKRAP